MKIAVIDHIGNPGGGSRVARSLLPALKRVRPEIDITFFGNPHSIKREQLDRIAAQAGFNIYPLASAKLAGRDVFNIRGSRHVIHLFQRKLERLLSPFSFYLSGAVHKELENVVKNYDLAFFIWPFHLKCPELKCPMAGIFHDFNFKYFFSGQTMAPWLLEFLNREMPLWLSKAMPIVSTEFMKGELEKFYPFCSGKTKVVPVAPTIGADDADKEKAARLIKDRFRIEKEYILCPTNISGHKNIGVLLSAFAILREGRFCEFGLSEAKQNRSEAFRTSETIAEQQDERDCGDTRKSGGLSQCKAGERSEPGPEGAILQSRSQSKFTKPDRAQYVLKAKGHDLLLVFTGPGTEIINGRACQIGLEMGSEPQDVMGLGYVAHEEMDALIQCAAVVVNSSLYEGGNIPGFDAWEKGVPVAMSNIPPFLEHMEVHRVHAEIFDPRSPEDIAEKIGRLLSNATETKRKALESQQNMRHFTWERSAEGYLKIFDGMLLEQGK